MQKKIGDFLLDLGVLTEKQVGEIVRYARSTGTRFGEAAVRLGLLRNDVPLRPYGLSYKIDFFHVNPKYFPVATRDLMPVEMIVRYGALPLGFKTKAKFLSSEKHINVGFLDPTQKESLTSVEAAIRTLDPSFAGMKIYLILADEFIEVLRSTYGLDEGHLQERFHSVMNRTLKNYLSSQTVGPS